LIGVTGEKGLKVTDENGTEPLAMACEKKGKLPTVKLLLDLKVPCIIAQPLQSGKPTSKRVHGSVQNYDCLCILTLSSACLLTLSSACLLALSSATPGRQT
jgi:hypothetical protein